MEDAWIHHGQKNHSMQDAKKCIDCIGIQKEFDDAVDKAGGLDNLIKEMENDVL